MLQIDIDIAMAAQKRRIPFMFVRNKADQVSGMGDDCYGQQGSWADMGA